MFYLKLITNDYIKYICWFLSLYLIPTIQVIPTYNSKLIPYELSREPSGPIDYEVHRSKINWLNPFRSS